MILLSVDFLLTCIIAYISERTCKNKQFIDVFCIIFSNIRQEKMVGKCK